MPKFKIKKCQLLWTFYYWVILFPFFCFIPKIEGTSSRRLGENDTELMKAALEEKKNHFGPFLYKCDSGGVTGDVTGDFLDIPKFLRVLYPPKHLNLRLTNYARILDTNPESLYNFSLISRHQQQDGSEGLGGGCMDGHFVLNISTNFDPTQTTFFNFTPDGWLGYSKNTEGWEDGMVRREEIYFPRENFCISSITPSHVTVKACKSQCYLNPEMEKGNHPCIPKCCRLGRVMTPRSCRIAMETLWTPSLYSHLESTKVNENILPNLYYNFLEYFWNCTKHGTEDIHLRHKLNELRVLTNGEIYSRNKFGKNLLIKEYPREAIGGGGKVVDFCIDGFWNQSATTDYLPQLNVQSSWTCRSNDLSVEEMGQRAMEQNFATTYLQIMFGITLTSSSIHFGILAVYTSLVEKQNIQGYTVMTFTWVQFALNLLRTIFFGIFAFDHDAPGRLKDAESGFYTFCVGSGILFHFFLISSFSWTTVISFDVWHKIRSMRPTSTSSKRIKRFLGIYCGFGFGLPSIIILISVLMEFSVGDTKSDDLIRPGYKETCVITEFWAYVYYVSLIIGGLFLTNMILVTLTLKSIVDARRDVKDFSNSEISSNFKNNARLISKLFVLMGIFLFFEILISLWNPGVKISIYFISLDFYRILHAVALFQIFVWNKKMGRQLLEKFPILENYLKFSSSAPASSAEPQSVGIATVKTLANTT